MSSITRVVVGGNEEILNCYEYDAWGNLTACEEKVHNRFKFNGQQYYLRARSYNPVIARFTQEDTYHGDGLNLYAYCANNPVYYEDPSGHNPDCVTKKANTYMQQGMSKEEAYRRAYAEHAQDKLANADLTLQERYKLEQRQKRLNASSNNNANFLYPKMDYKDAGQQD